MEDIKIQWHPGFVAAMGLEFMFQAQIVVTRELDMEEHAWLRALSEDVGREDARKLLEKIKGLTGQEDQSMADSVLRVMMDANAQIVEEWRGDADMIETLMEIMEPQMQLRDEQIRKEGKKEWCKELLMCFGSWDAQMQI